MEKNKPTFWKLFWLFVKISLISFGGGNAFFPFVKSYCVDKYHWITDEDVDDILIITNSMPGASTVEAIAYISNLLLKSKWKATIVTILSLIPHTAIFFGLFIIGIKFISQEYLKVIYVAVIPIIIALMLNLTIRYIKSNKKEMPVTIHWLIVVITTAFSVFVPVPWSIPIFIIIFFVICLLVYKLIKKHKENKRD